MKQVSGMKAYVHPYHERVHDTCGPSHVYSYVNLRIFLNMQEADTKHLHMSCASIGQDTHSALCAYYNVK
jgi:hypothetical protein